MIRFILRASGFLLVAVAFAILVVDGSRSIAGGRVLFCPLGDAAAWLGGATAVGAPQFARRLAAGLLAAGLLAAPASLVSAALGLLLLVAGRPAPAGVGSSERD